MPRCRLSILKALAGVSWGQSKEVLLLTYRALIKPVLSYAAPVWFPNASDTAISSLQTIQNSALRIATGSLRMASIPHLHQEAGVLRVGPHLGLEGLQAQRWSCRLCHLSGVRGPLPVGPAPLRLPLPPNHPCRPRPVGATSRGGFLPLLPPVLLPPPPPPPLDPPPPEPPPHPWSVADISNNNNTTSIIEKIWVDG